MSEILQRRWAVFPIISAVLMMLTFYPMRLWIFAFIVPAPFLYFLLACEGRHGRRIFEAGFIFGSLIGLVASYTSFIQFHWLPEAHLFTNIVNLLFIPLTLFGGVIWGIFAFMYARLRLGIIVLDTVLFAFLWVALEGFSSLLLGHYNILMLAFAVGSLQQFMHFAAIGGVLFVSFLVVLIGSFIAAIAYILMRGNWKAMWGVGNVVCVSVIGLSTILMMHRAYLATGEVAKRVVSIAVIQNLERKENSFGMFYESGFSFPRLEESISQALLQKSDVVIYPFSPFIGALYPQGGSMPVFNKDVFAGSIGKFEVWSRSYIPRNTALITWDTVFRGDGFYNEFNVWEDGAFSSYYQKRSLFPFIDYTPLWAQRFNFYSTSFDNIAGSAKQKSLVASGTHFNSLICSEIHNPNLVDPRSSDIILSIGSDAVFYGNVVGYIDLINAQYRAAEYHMPAIRGNRFGPSALIDANGRIIAKMDAGQEGVLSGTISYSPNTRQTLYSKIGDWGFWSLAIAYLLYMLWLKRRHG